MAEDEKETFGKKVDNYANQYEVALKENAAAFKEVALECIAKGIKTTEDVVRDAKKAGIAVKTQTITEMKKVEDFAKQKYNNTKEKISETRDKVTTKAGEVRDSVVAKSNQVRKEVKETAEKARDGIVDGVAKTAGAVVLTGRLGKQAVIKGAKTIQGAGEKVYSSTKGTAKKGVLAVGKWFQARGKEVKEAKDAVKSKAGEIKQGVITKAGKVREDIVDKAETAAIYGLEAKDTVVKTARNVRDGVVDKAETAAIYGLEAKDTVVKTARNVRDGVVDKAETAAIYGLEAKDAVVKTAEKARDGIVDGAAKTAGAVVLTGRLGKQAVIKGAKTIQGAGEKVYSSTKGTAKKGVLAVGKWFQARGKEVKEAKDAVKSKAGEIKQGVITKAGKVREDIVDKAETAAIYGLEAKDTVVKTARNVRDGVVDKAETAAIYGLEAKDTVVKTARNVRDGVVDRAETAAIYGLEAKDTVVKTAKKVRDGVIDKAETARDGIVDSAAKVAAVSVAAKNITQDAIENASRRIQTRTNMSIINMVRSGKSFMNGFLDKIENSAVSREERNQEAVRKREEAKAKSESKEQDDQVK